MRMLITGGSGFVGKALCRHWADHSVATLGRGDWADFQWDPATGILDTAALKEVDAVVHLAGEPLGPGRWSAAKKRRILDSRIKGTRLLCKAIQKQSNPPQVLLCASGTGFYGNRGETEVEESAVNGNGFLADVCRQWEAATGPAEAAGVRVIHMRFGIVLGSEGGVLQAMRPVFRMGLGGRLGDGRQWMPWIGMVDLCRALDFLLTEKTISGPVNVVAGAVRNGEFTRALGEVLGRPSWFPVPAGVLRLVLGEVADEMLLTSTRAKPRRLNTAGFELAQPDIGTALRAALL